MAGGKIMFKMYYFRKWGQLVIIKQNRNILMISDDQEENKMKLLYRHRMINDQERKTYIDTELKCCCHFIPSLKNIKYH